MKFSKFLRIPTLKKISEPLPLKTFIVIAFTFVNTSLSVKNNTFIFYRFKHGHKPLQFSLKDLVNLNKCVVSHFPGSHLTNKSLKENFIFFEHALSPLEIVIKFPF